MLTFMAQRGVNDADLQLLSGHKKKETLMRYLGWGARSSEAAKAAERRHTIAQATQGPKGGSANACRKQCQTKNYVCI
jgi:hypothetical protein